MHKGTDKVEFGHFERKAEPAVAAAELLKKDTVWKYLINTRIVEKL